MPRFLASLIGACLALAALLGPVAAQIPGCPTVGSNCVTIQGFQPLTKTTLAVSSASSNVALPTPGASYNVLITNAGSTDAYLLLGTTSGVVATTSNPILPAGQSAWFPQGTNAYVAAITASSTTNLTIQSGAGTPTIVTAQGTFSLAPGTSVSITGTVTTTPAATTHVQSAALAANLVVDANPGPSAASKSPPMQHFPLRHGGCWCSTRQAHRLTAP